MTTVTVPDTPEGLQEVLTDRAKRTALFADDKAFPEFMTKYVKAFGVKDKGYTKDELAEQVQMGIADFFEKAKYDPGKVPVDMRPSNVDWGKLDKQTGHKGLYNEAAPGVKMEGKLGSTRREMFQALSTRPPKNRTEIEQWTARRTAATEVMNSFGSEVPADGGFLIPETLRSEILAVALEEAVVRSRATVIPMESLRVPIPAIDDTSHVSSVYGGVAAYWTEEAGALTESQATFSRVVLDAKKLAAYAAIPNELLADASAMAGFFNARFPSAIAYFEDVAFMTGTGVGQPLGFINCDAAIIATAQSGQGANTVVWENIAQMYSQMLPTSLNKAEWIVSPDVMYQLLTMALSVGTGGGPVWIGSGYSPGNSGASSPPMTLLGRPIRVSEKASALGTTGDINFVDLSYYLIGDRQSVMIDTSEHYKFANDMTVYRIIERIDGRPWIQSAISPHNNSSNKLSPFIQLSSTRT